MSKLFHWSQAIEIVRGTVILLVAIGLFAWLMARSLKRSEDPPRLIVKWVVSAIVIGFMLWKISPLAESGGSGSWMAVVMTLICGLILAVIWRHSMGEIIARPFEVLYNGGDIAPEPRP